jgi:RNA polymerase sigma factor (sigma-70 family)
MADDTRLSLIDLLQDNPSDAAWSEFIDIYGSLVSGWLLREGVQHVDAEDVQQEVMTTVLKNIATFQHNGHIGAFRKWLRMIAANRLRRLWDQKTKREREVSLVDLSSIASQLGEDSSRISVLWDKEHDNYVIDRMISQLSDRFGEKSIDAFRRIMLQQQPAEKVALDLNMTLGAVRVAQHRVLKALRAQAANVHN